MDQAGAPGRLLRGTLANVAGQVINACGQFVLVPVLLRCWGSQRYGEWQTLSAAATYMVLLDFGMQTYVANRLNQAYSRRNMGEFTRVLHSALSFSLTVCSAAALVIIPIILSLPMDRWFQLKQTSRLLAVEVAAILAFQTIWALPMGVIGGIYRSIGEYAREVTIANIHRLAVIGLTVLIATRQGGFQAVALMQVAVLGGVALFACTDLRRRHPEIRIGVKQGDIRLAVSFLAPSLLFLLMQLSVALTLQGSTLIVGAALGAGTVAVFASLRTLVNVISQATNSLASTLWPEFTSLEAKGYYSVLKEAHLTATKVVLSLGFCAAVFLHFMGRDIVAWWTGGRIAYDPLLMNALLLFQLTEVWFSMSALVLGSSNRHKGVAVSYLVSGSLGLTLGYFLSLRVGPGGIALGLALGNLAASAWWVPRSACRMLGQNFPRFALGVLGRGFFALASLYGAVYVVWLAFFGRHVVEKMAAGGLAAAATGLVVLYAGWLNQAERRLLRSFLPASFTRVAA